MGMKGHAIFELTNTKTGEKRVYEDDNMVTNFLEQFCIPTGPLNYNLQSMLICGQSNASGCSVLTLGLMSLFTGGLLLFEDEIDEDADNIWPRAGNKMTAQAGVVAHSGSNARAGSYNGTESGPVENGYRHVWDFTTNQGNGQISCACLTTAWGGILGAGTDAFYSDFTNIAYPFFSRESTNQPSYQSGFTTEGPPVLVDYNKNCYYTLKGVGTASTDNPGGCLVFSWFLTKKITVRRCKLPFSELSIFQKSPHTIVESDSDFEDLVFPMPQEVIDSVTDYDNTLIWSNLSTKVANVNTAINAWGKHIYIYFGLTNASPSTINNTRYINPGDDLVIVDIDTEAETCNAFKVKNTTGQSLTLRHGSSRWSGFSKCPSRAQVGSDGNYSDIGYCSTYNDNNAPIFVTDKYVIMQMSDGVIYRISRVDNTDVKAFTYEGDEAETPIPFGDPYRNINCVPSFTPLGKNVEQFNKNKVLAARYESKQAFLFDFDRAKVEWVLKSRDDGSCYKGFVNILGTDLLVTDAKDVNYSNGGCTIYGATMPFMLTTINNLDSPVHKTSADTMKVTYIITNGDV